MDTARTGSPARDTGLPPGVEVGGIGRRLVAYVIDSVIPAAVILQLVRVVPNMVGVVAAIVGMACIAAAIAWAIVCWWTLSQRAATPGMRLMRIQLVGFEDGRPVGWGRALSRWAIFTLLQATGVGLVAMLVALLLNPRHQGWHDLVAGGVVIKERPVAPVRPLPLFEEVDTGDVEEEVEAPVAPAPEPTPVAPAPAAPVQAETAVLPADTAPVTPPAPEPPARSILEGWAVELDDGRRIAVDGLVLVGRNPQPAAGEEDAQLVKLSDESRTVSKTHLALGVDDAGLFVVDRDSTNGSTVTTPDRVSTRCTPRTAVSVGVGSIVSIGDHWLRIRRDES